MIVQKKSKVHRSPRLKSGNLASENGVRYHLEIQSGDDNRGKWTVKTSEGGRQDTGKRLEGSDYVEKHPMDVSGVVENNEVNNDVWWPTLEKDGSSALNSEHHEKDGDEIAAKRAEIIDNSLRDLRDNLEADDGGMEKKLENLPPNFWKGISSKIKVKVPLICNVFHTHELALEGLLTTYLNMVGLAAHKGVKKYCKLVTAGKEPGRVSHNEGEENGPDSLLVRFFNFINSRLENFLGISNEDPEVPQELHTEDLNDVPEETKNLIFPAQNVNLFFLPSALTNDQKLKFRNMAKDNESLKELQGIIQDLHETSTPSHIDDTSLKVENGLKSGCEGPRCHARGTRHTQPEGDYQDDDYFDEGRRHVPKVQHGHHGLQYDELDLNPPYDINLLDPELAGEEPLPEDIPDEEKREESRKPTDFAKFISTHRLLPPTRPATTESQPVIGQVHLSKPTTSPEFPMTLPVKLLIFIPLALLVLVMFIILLYVFVQKRKKTREYDHVDDGNISPDIQQRNRFGNMSVEIEQEESSDDWFAHKQRPVEQIPYRPPPTIHEKGNKKTRTQSYKDDFVPIGPKKKRKFLRRNK